MSWIVIWGWFSLIIVLYQYFMNERFRVLETILLIVFTPLVLVLCVLFLILCVADSLIALASGRG